MASATLDALVLDAAQRQSLLTVRSLGASGLRVGAYDVSPGAPAFRSKWCVVSGVLPDFADDPDAFLAAVLDLLTRHQPRVLIAAHDGTIALLRKHRHELESRVALALSPEPALELAVTKNRLLSLADQLGIATPQGVLVEQLGSLPAALAESGVPAVLKPQTSWVAQDRRGERFGAEIAVDACEAETICQRLLAAGTSVLVQEWLPGAREAVWLLYAEERVWARFAHIASRSLPIVGGSCVMRESITPPADIAEAAEQLVVAAGITGVCQVEFRRDATGAAKLMEINPRLPASSELPMRAGVDFPALLYAWAAGLPLPEITGYRRGVRLRWLSGDLLWLAQTLRARGRPDAEPPLRALGVFAADFLRPTAYDCLTLSDLRPALSASAGFLSDIAGRIRARSAPARACGA
jgi:predicted ATP-grasp superfamily ATP-dependent carboligase